MFRKNDKTFGKFLEKVLEIFVEQSEESFENINLLGVPENTLLRRSCKNMNSRKICDCRFKKAI